MKTRAFFMALLISAAVGCAHGNHPPPSPEGSQAIPEKVPASTGQAISDRRANALPAKVEGADVELYGDYKEEEMPEIKSGIADPLEPFNRAMFGFNDKLYFWLLKPVAQGYRDVVPEPARVGVQNLFSNLSFPVRFVNCLLQANFSGAVSEAGRFVVNTLWGIGGLLDPASGGEMGLSQQDEDLGQTLGSYGLGHGFFIVWPLLGPSSPRDTAGLIGDSFLRPLNYIDPIEAVLGIRAYEEVNDTSLRIGDYESLKEAAVDPYLAVRDAYIQYRLNKVKTIGAVPVPSAPRGKAAPSMGPKERLPQ